jgi:hypothetical protein
VGSVGQEFCSRFPGGRVTGGQDGQKGQGCAASAWGPRLAAAAMAVSSTVPETGPARLPRRSLGMPPRSNPLPPLLFPYHRPHRTHPGLPQPQTPPPRATPPPSPTPPSSPNPTLLTQPHPPRLTPPNPSPNPPPNPIPFLQVRAIITGPSDTPYEGGLFIFDVYFPAGYPQVWGIKGVGLGAGVGCVC